VWSKATKGAENVHVCTYGWMYSQGDPVREAADIRVLLIKPLEPLYVRSEGSAH
jgi:hypothetical protein